MSADAQLLQEVGGLVGGQGCISRAPCGSDPCHRNPRRGNAPHPTGEVGSVDDTAARNAALHGMDYLVPDLQKDDVNRLPTSPQTVARLKALAVTMADPAFGPDASDDSRIRPPARARPGADVAGGGAPADPQRPHRHARSRQRCRRHAGAGPGRPVTRRTRRRCWSGGSPSSATRDSRGRGRHARRPQQRAAPAAQRGPELDRAARIGDPATTRTRSSQLHVAFLKAHNRLVDGGHTFEEARRALRRYYQYVVVHDFLKRIADPAVVDEILTDGMVRDGYDFNLNFRDGAASLELRFTFSALSGQLGKPGRLPAGRRLRHPPRELDHRVGAPRRGERGPGRAGPPIPHPAGRELRRALFNLQTVDGQPEVGLARNLLRGYRMRMPTGQALARHLGVPIIEPDELRAVTGGEQAQALADGGLLDATPLWFSVLAEARAHGGARLGPLGSRIVAEVLIGLVRRSADSFLAVEGWVPTLPSVRPDSFELADLLRYARVRSACDAVRGTARGHPRVDRRRSPLRRDLVGRGLRRQPHPAARRLRPWPAARGADRRHRNRNCGSTRSARATRSRASRAPCSATASAGRRSSPATPTC